MSVCTGMAAASLYYAQPLLGSIRQSLHIDTATAGLIVSVTQIGYISGLVLLVPLGDMFVRRALLPLLVVGLALFLGLVSGAPSAGLLLAGSLIVGTLSVAAQITVAFSASLAADEDRGRIVGTVMSGLLLGILLARTASGYLAELGGWRTPFRVAAVVMALLAVVLWRFLPGEEKRAPVNYLKVLRSVPVLLKEEPQILLRSVYGAAAFGAFNALWTPLAFLLSGPPYHYTTSVIGLFGLLGVTGALAASFAGRVADRGRTAGLTAVTTGLMLLCWVPIALGRHSLGALVLGILVLDFAVQGLHITNQSVIYRLRPEARSRVTSAYMACYFIGGVLGSVSAAAAYAHGGWGADAAVGAAFGLLALGLWGVGAARRRSVAQSAAGRSAWGRSAAGRSAAGRSEDPSGASSEAPCEAGSVARSGTV
jgi:predicted MFS family arabinose efflux permease